MTFTEPEQQFMSAQRRGRLATIAPGGSPQVKPVGFAVNAELGTIDIAGFNMSGSAKFRNILANPKVAFVVDEVIFEGIDGVRFMEIRGTAEAAMAPVPPDSFVGPDLIRIRPRRILAFNIDPERPGLQTRDVELPGAQLPGPQLAGPPRAGAPRAGAPRAGAPRAGA
jgi:pyridoxamine 5'-phosphate oxidase family protein